MIEDVFGRNRRDTVGINTPIPCHLCAAQATLLKYKALM